MPKGFPACSFLFGNYLYLVKNMSLLLKKKHLLIEVPQTIDGINLRYDAFGKPVIKTTILPLSAERSVKSNQSKKPAHLQGKITVREGDIPEKKVVKKNEEFTPEQIEKLNAIKNKGGRPKKVTE